MNTKQDCLSDLHATHILRFLNIPHFLSLPPPPSLPLGGAGRERQGDPPEQTTMDAMTILKTDKRTNGRQGVQLHCSGRGRETDGRIEFGDGRGGGGWCRMKGGGVWGWRKVVGVGGQGVAGRTSSSSTHKAPVLPWQASPRHTYTIHSASLPRQTPAGDAQTKARPPHASSLLQLCPTWRADQVTCGTDGRQGGSGGRDGGTQQGNFRLNQLSPPSPLYFAG